MQADPAAAFDTNVRGTWTLLEACREHGVERVVFASSDKAYGAHEVLPYEEDFALRPTAPYEASKAAADLIARSYWPSYGLPVAVTRFANIYGGGDLNFSRLVPEAVCAAIEGRAPVLRSDGSPVRDLLHVEDAAAAYLAIADRLDRDAVRGQAFNAGGERPYSVLEIVAAITRLAGTGVEPEIRGTGNPRGRDRPAVRRCRQAPRALRMGAAGQPRGRITSHDRLVRRAPRGQASRLRLLRPALPQATSRSSPAYWRATTGGENRSSTARRRAARSHLRLRTASIAAATLSGVGSKIGSPTSIPR